MPRAAEAEYLKQSLSHPTGQYGLVGMGPLVFLQMVELLKEARHSGESLLGQQEHMLMQSIKRVHRPALASRLLAGGILVEQQVERNTQRQRTSRVVLRLDYMPDGHQRRRL